MNLVKWFRKNNKKVMAVVVIVLMVGFIGGSSISYIFQGSGGRDKAIAYYGKHKIDYYDRDEARQELEILQVLGAPQVLQAQDLLGIVLSELLFSQDRATAEVMSYARQTIQRNRYRVGDKQLSQIYDRTATTDIYWILLREEAHMAGIHVSNEDVGRLLAQVIPQIAPGQTYTTVMQSMVNRYGMAESNILTVFGKVLAVLQYAQAICSQEAVTGSEVRHLASQENETMNTDCVEMKAAYFIDKTKVPPEADLAEQFDNFKTIPPGEPNETNPYGFGYRLPDRLQLEYIALKLADVDAIVPAPTQEEMETFYRNNRDRLFTEQVPTDPNDPNSPMMDQLKNFSEVSGDIQQQLTQKKVLTKAEQILIDARNVADANLASLSSKRNKPPLAELEKEAGDYKQIAQNLGVKYGTPLYYGRTGLLSAVDIQTDDYLGRLALTNYGANPVPLGQLLFTVKQLGEGAVTMMSIPPAQMFRSIGPARDLSAANSKDWSGQIMALVRIVEVKPTAPPANLNVTYSTRSIRVGDSSADDDVYSVKEKVVEDLQKLAAWDLAKTRAQEFVAMATKDGWDSAADKYNELYGAQAKEDPNDPNVFEVQYLTGLRRIPAEQMQVIATQLGGNPAAQQYLRRLGIQRRFLDRLYSLIPGDKDAVTEVPLVMEFKPEQSYYCLRTLTIDRMNQAQFQSVRPALLSREEHTETQSLSIVHLDPENILKRMDFRYAEQVTPADANETEAPQEG